MLPIYLSGKCILSAVGSVLSLGNTAVNKRQSGLVFGELAFLQDSLKISPWYSRALLFLSNVVHGVEIYALSGEFQSNLSVSHPHRLNQRGFKLDSRLCVV